MRSASSLPQAKIDRLVELFNSGRHLDLETQSRLLAKRYPHVGFVWKTLGLALHAQGKDALPALQKAARLLPNDAEAHANLGALLASRGQLGDAVVSYRNAHSARPDDVSIAFNLGVTLYEWGQLEEAAVYFQRVLSLDSGFGDAHFYLGNAQLGLGQCAEAVASYGQALAINPAFAEAHCNLSKALTDLGQCHDAVASGLQALQLKPDYFDAQINLGNALKACGHVEAAKARYCQAIEINPDSALAHNHLGQALEELGQHVEAIASFRHALAIRPDYIDALFNLGSSQEELGQFEEAVASYHSVLNINPDFFAALVNLGHVFEAWGRPEAAVQSYQKALTIDADNAYVHRNLGNVLRDSGQLELAMQSLQRAMAIDPDFLEAHSNLLFLHAYQARLSPPVLLAESRKFGALVARLARRHTDWPNLPDVGRRLRVGLVSGDFGNHPVGYFIDSVLAELVRNPDNRLQLSAYSSCLRQDEVTARIRACCQNWHDIADVSDEDLARQIRDDGIDILIDLAGHTAHNRLPLFAWKPAPVQVSWLGYFATTGLTEMDYVLADQWTVRAGETSHFTEQVWRLPETYLCFTAPDVALDVGPLPCLSSEVITFGCFNNLAKLSDAVVALWARVLLAVPDSRLFLKTFHLGDVARQHQLAQRFAVHGIDAARLILEGAAPRAELLAAYNRVDIALDPFPYPGGTTSVEALWMGVPVLTLAGDRFLSRIGESILQNAGLPDWIAVDADDYVMRAVAHASDAAGLSKLRQGLRQQVLTSPLFDAPRFARHFEAALRGMWADWCHASNPAASHLNASDRGFQDTIQPSGCSAGME